MSAQEFFTQAVVYLAAMVVAVPLAKRLGLGSVLGYLVAGVAIGPSVLGFVGAEGSDVMHFAEFGVVMMLFLIGLELQPLRLWRMRVPILGLGGGQVLATTFVVAGLALAFGQTWNVALAIGMILSMSSTAIVLQTLNEKGLTKTHAGEAAFSTLLFQDIAVIPMLAILPLLGGELLAEAGHASGGHGGAWHLENWQRGLLLAAIVVALAAFGRYLSGPLFRFVAAARLREAFTATALLLVIGISILAQLIGLSPALGAFLAGVALAESEFRRELETDLEPFKGLLLGVFFISVGASIDFGDLMRMPLVIAGLTFGLVLVKLVVLLGVGRAAKMSASQNATYSFSLAQGGEFAFVLFSFATQNAVLGEETVAPLVAAVAFSMIFTPLLFIVNEKLIQPKSAPPRQERSADSMEDADGTAIIVGFGRFGHIVGRVLRANGVPLTILDSDPEQIEFLRNLGVKSYFGDGSRLELLEAAGIADAKLLVIALQDIGTSTSIVEAVRQRYPNLPIFARARGRFHAYELRRMGLQHVYRETLDTSLEMSIDALKTLGMRAYQARRAARIFKKHDEVAVRELGQVWREGDEKTYLQAARQRIENLEAIIANDEQGSSSKNDAAWTSAKEARKEKRQ